MDKVCSRCGQSFGCNSGNQCWCEGVALTRDQLQWLKDHFDDCLCPACLTLVGDEMEKVD